MTARGVEARRGAASDSLLLTLVKAVTAVLGLAATKLLSTRLSLAEYGAYAQAMLVASTATSLSILGLTDAVNYFYNAAVGEDERRSCISAVFGLQYAVGLLTGLLICLFSGAIAGGFHNPDLRGLLYIVAWMPVLNNLIPMLQMLFVSIGRAKTVALRNFIASLARLLIVVAACRTARRLEAVFILIVAVDVAQVIWLTAAFARARFPIRLSGFDVGRVRSILSFSVPMAVYVFAGALSRDIDKYVVGFFHDAGTLGIYANAARPLPFDLIAASFFTVLAPVITRFIRAGERKGAATCVKACLRAGYLSTWTLAGGALVCAGELLRFLYDDKFLPGLPVFAIYLVTDMARFANLSIVLTARGRTRTLMRWSLVSLALNLALSVPACLLLGVVGPALATLAVTIGLTLAFLLAAAKELAVRPGALLDGRELLGQLLRLVAVGGAAALLRRVLIAGNAPTTVVLFATYGAFVGAMLLLNRQRVQDCLREINQFR